MKAKVILIDLISGENSVGPPNHFCLIDLNWYQLCKIGLRMCFADAKENAVFAIEVIGKKSSKHKDYTDYTGLFRLETDRNSGIADQ